MKLNTITEKQVQELLDCYNTKLEIIKEISDEMDIIDTNNEKGALRFEHLYNRLNVRKGEVNGIKLALNILGYDICIETNKFRDNYGKAVKLVKED